MKQFKHYIEKLISELGIEATAIEYPSNIEELHYYSVHIGEAEITVVNPVFDDGYNFSVSFSLPEHGSTAKTFLDYCATKENISVNHEGRYCTGPVYKDHKEALMKKQTFVIEVWNQNLFYIGSVDYGFEETDEAVNNVILLAKQFSKHLEEYPSIKVWDKDEPEVIEKVKEIVKNADLYETNVEMETKRHYLIDRNSFIKGWFNPFKGIFDITYPSSVEQVASLMAERGTFDYAVACNILDNAEYIEKARKACVIREAIIRY